LQLRKTVNKPPDFVRYITQRLKTLCPSMGKVKIADRRFDAIYSRRNSNAD